MPVQNPKKPNSPGRGLAVHEVGSRAVGTARIEAPETSPIGGKQRDQPLVLGGANVGSHTEAATKSKAHH